MTGKPVIESDRVEGTTVYDPAGNNIGSIKRVPRASCSSDRNTQAEHTAISTAVTAAHLSEVVADLADLLQKEFRLANPSAAHEP
jgi:hypothetical protein